MVFILVIAFFGSGAGAFVVWAPVGIEHHFDGQLLVVRTRLGWWSDWKRVHIAEITDATAETVRGRSRLRGTGRPGYCEGLFRYENLGKVRNATTCVASVVVLRRSRGLPVVLSPDDPDGFIEALRTHTPGSFPTTIPAEPVTGVWLLAKIMTLSLLLVPFFLLRIKGITYVIEDGRLKIRGPIGWSNFSLANRSARKHTPKRLIRVFGAGAPGYWAGYFRGDGGSLRVYATRRSDGVVLEGSPRIWVTPTDPDGFLEALREAGVTVGG